MAVNVHDKNENIVARVEYNAKLDFWDGHNRTSGSAGHHLGITKLRDGSFVLIYGSEWESDRDHAKIVTAEIAIDAILRSGNMDILEEKKFSELKELMETTLLKEAPDDPETQE